MEDYYEYLDSNGVTTLYKLIKDDTVALIDSYSVTINGITTTLDTHINDSDIHTPISDIESMVDTKISGLVNSAPETLDTLKELSDALGNNPNFATTVANQIGNKASKDDVYTKEETDTLLEGKANSVHTHVVNDITDFPTIPTKTSELTNDSGYITSVSWEDVTSKPELSQVAISGSYSDLNNTPTIPTRTSQLINDSGFLTSSSGVITSVSWSDITDKPNFSTVATSGSYTDLSNTPTIPTKVSQLENDMGFGTGGDTNDCVHKTGNETIDGIKTFTQDIICLNNYIDLTVTPSSTLYSNFIFKDKNNLNASFIQYAKHNTGPDLLGLYIHDKDKNLHGVQITTNNELSPIGNNYSLGSSSGYKWANIYATNAHITNTYTNRVTTYSITHPTDDNYFFVSGGSEWNKGANLFLYGNSLTGGNAGSFELVARNSTEIRILTGFPNGSLTWGGKNIATTEWVINYVNSVRSNAVGTNAVGTNAVGTNAVRSYAVGFNEVGSSIAAYYSNATTLTAEGSETSSGGNYPSDYSDYINISPKVGTIYTGSQLFSNLNASASGSKFIPPGSSSPTYQTTAKATANFSGAFSSSAKYLCTTANAVRFRAYVSQGTPSDIGSASVVDNSSTKSIFIRVQ